jgi:hypothetical protein
LAIERYATDADGNYPYFLFGGEGLFNIGTINYFNPPNRNRPFCWTQQIHLPFDMFWIDSDTWDYIDGDDAGGWTALLEGDVDAGYGDTISFEGYMPKYPTNPFQKGRRATIFSAAGKDFTNSSQSRGGWAAYGGRDGHLMWDLGEGWGEVIHIIEFPDEFETVDLDFAGNFAYHPRWGDGVTNYEHNLYQLTYNPGSWLAYDFLGFTPLNQFEDEINSLDVAGYDLVAVGSARTKGQDLDNSIAYFGADHYFRTGYLTLAQERNPFVGPGAPEGDYGGLVDVYDERPSSDSVPDFYIIHLGSGMDKKVGNPQRSF